MAHFLATWTKGVMEGLDACRVLILVFSDGWRLNITVLRSSFLAGPSTGRGPARNRRSKVENPFICWLAPGNI
jgi:hypothetical protein